MTTKYTQEEIRTRIMVLTDFLQDYTDLAERLDSWGDTSDEATDNNPAGDYALIERWITTQLGDGDGVEELMRLHL